MIPVLIFDKTQPQDQRRRQVEVPNIEDLLSRYNDENKYVVYINGKLVNVIVKESE